MKGYNEQGNDYLEERMKTIRRQKRQKMKVSGKSVIGLKKIIAGKNTKLKTDG